MVKWTDSIIGKIGFVDTNNNLFYKEAIKKIPKNARIMEAWECMELLDNDFNAFKNIPKDEWYYTKSNNNYFRACGLSGLGDSFDALDMNLVSSSDALRGVLIVKKE